jgi:hypothetical protein
MSLQKCTFKGCDATGEPNEGFDFYACEPCLDELERLIEVEGRKQQEDIYRKALNN